MVLIWTGRGILVFAVFIVIAVLTTIFTVTEISAPYKLTVSQSTDLTIAIAALLSAIVTFPIGRLVMKQPRARQVADPRTGQTDWVQAYDTLLWIDVTHWTYIFGIIAVVMAVVTYLA